MPEITLEPNTQVFRARHPAEEITGCRVHSRSMEGATALMALPTGTAPSLGHLGMLADIATGQALMGGIRAGQGIRTVGLHLHLAGTLKSGTFIRGWGEQVFFNGNNGLSRGTLYSPDGAISAIATGRFMVVEDHHSPYDSRTEPLTTVVVPREWDTAFGIQTQHTSQGQAVLVVVPKERTRNRAPIMHGGLQVRALELAMRAAGGFAADTISNRLSDIAVTFHRPVPIDGHTTILATGAVQPRGRRIVIVTGALESEDGRVLARAQGSFLLDPTQNPSVDS